MLKSLRIPMKTVTCIPLLSLLTFPVLAQSTPDQQEAFLQAQNALLQCMEELQPILAGVTDRNTADATAPEVREQAEKMKLVRQQAVALGTPSPQTAKYVKKACQKRQKALIDGVFEPLLDLLMMEPPCYGSVELEQALILFMDTIAGESEKN